MADFKSKTDQPTAADTERNIRKVLKEIDKQSDNKKGTVISRLVDYMLRCGILVDIGFKVYNLASAGETFNFIDDLIELVKDFKPSYTSRVAELGEQINHPKIKEVCEGICSNGNVNCVGDTLKTIERSKEEMANSIIQNSAITSCVLITIQVVKLIFVWKDLRNAKNIHKESKEKFPEIECNINKMENDMKEIHDLIEQYNNETDNEEKKDLARDINTAVSTLNSLYSETIVLVSDVKFMIGSSIERLDLRANELIMDGISNLVQCISNLAQLITLGDIASQGYQIVQGITTTLYFGIAMANFEARSYTKSMLVELRQSMEIVKQFEAALKSIKKQLNEVEAWLKDLRQKRRCLKIHGENITCLNCVDLFKKKQSTDFREITNNERDDLVYERQLCKNHAENIRCMKCLNLTS